MITIVIILGMTTIIFIAQMITIAYIEEMTTILLKGAMQIRRPSELGAIIGAARKARGLTQDDLAERLGVSRVWLGQIERGKPSARIDLVFRVLNELEIMLAVYPQGGVPEGDAGPRAPKSLIHIDSIADTNLARAPSGPQRRR